MVSLPDGEIFFLNVYSFWRDPDRQTLRDSKDRIASHGKNEHKNSTKQVVKTLKYK